MKKYFLSVTVLLAIAFAGHAQKIKNLNVVKTDAGLVSGTTNPTAIYIFLEAFLLPHHLLAN